MKEQGSNDKFKRRWTATIWIAVMLISFGLGLVIGDRPWPEPQSDSAYPEQSIDSLAHYLNKLYQAQVCSCAVESRRELIEIYVQQICAGVYDPTDFESYAYALAMLADLRRAEGHLERNEYGVCEAKYWPAYREHRKLYDDAVRDEGMKR